MLLHGESKEKKKNNHGSNKVDGKYSDKNRHEKDRNFFEKDRERTQLSEEVILGVERRLKINEK